MKQKITVYEKPTCTTCKNLAVLLKDNGIGANQLKALLKKLDIPAYGLLRTKEPQFKELGFTADTPEADIIAAIVANPGLLNRPIVEVGDKAVIARPIDKALELISNLR